MKWDRKTNTVWFHLNTKSKTKKKRQKKKNKTKAKTKNKYNQTEAIKDTENKQIKDRNRWGTLRNTNFQFQNKWVTCMKCTVWGIQSIITYYLCMMTDGNKTYCGDDFEMYRNIHPLHWVAGNAIQLYLKN